MKICFTASSGGHFEQLMMMKPMMERYESFIITEKTSYSNNIQGIPVYYLSQINRREGAFVIKLIKNLVHSIRIYEIEKPDVVISTGVLATIPTCLWAKLRGSRIVYIESFAKINSPTITGKLMYRVADLFFVQWEPMLQYFPNAIYKGGIY